MRKLCVSLSVHVYTNVYIREHCIHNKLSLTQYVSLSFLLNHSAIRTNVRGKATVADANKGQFNDFCVSTWSSDPGAYPIIIILGFAVSASAAYINYKVFWDNDVRFDPKKRGAVVRTWG